MKVVCIDDSTFHDAHPVKGEICEVIDTKEYNGKLWYRLHGYNTRNFEGLIYGYNSECFRLVDNSFGEWVEETIMKEVELETILQ